MNTQEFLTSRQASCPPEKRWHFLPWRLELLTKEQLMDAFTMMFHDSKYIKLREERTALYNRVVTLQDDPKTTPSRLRGALNAIIEKDNELGKKILECMALYSYDNGKKELMTMDELRGSFDDITPEQEQCLVKLALIHRRMGFKMDSIEWDIMDMCDTMKKLRPDLNYMGADGVRIALSQLREMIGVTNSCLDCEEEKILYAETADSISAYLDKRIVTFMKHCAQIKKRKQKQDNKKK